MNECNHWSKIKLQSLLVAECSKLDFSLEDSKVLTTCKLFMEELETILLIKLNFRKIPKVSGNFNFWFNKNFFFLESSREKSFKGLWLILATKALTSVCTLNFSHIPSLLINKRKQKRKKSWTTKVERSLEGLLTKLFAKGMKNHQRNNCEEGDNKINMQWCTYPANTLHKALSGENGNVRDNSSRVVCFLLFLSVNFLNQRREI